MEGELLQLVYLSRASHGLDGADLDAIRESAEVRNAVNGVTGVLLFDGDRFIQALEGREQAVREVMAKIMNDARHGSIEIVAEGIVDRRQFGNWAMVVKRTPPGTCSRAFLDQVKLDLVHVTDPNLKAAFIGFARLA